MSPEHALFSGLAFLGVCVVVAVVLFAVGFSRRRQPRPGDPLPPIARFSAPLREVVPTPAPVEHLSVEQLRKLRADEARKKEDAELAAIRQAEIDRLLGASAAAPKA